MKNKNLKIDDANNFLLNHQKQKHENIVKTAKTIYNPKQIKTQR